MSFFYIKSNSKVGKYFPFQGESYNLNLVPAKFYILITEDTVYTYIEFDNIPELEGGEDGEDLDEEGEPKEHRYHRYQEPAQCPHVKKNFSIIENI